MYINIESTYSSPNPNYELAEAAMCIYTINITITISIDLLVYQ